HIAVLVTGWLAVALSSAAIGSSSVARVGLGSAKPQWQITVARSVDASTSAPIVGDAADDILEPVVAPARSEGRLVSVAPYVRPFVLVPTTTSTTFAPAAASAAPSPADAPPSSLPAPEATAPADDGNDAPPILETPKPSSWPSIAPGKSGLRRASNGKASILPVPTLLTASPTPQEALAIVE
ncbi:MAG: hypothetical protein HY829_05765, partial [Actinobacteria bacterium]|nr:hypothetical protein [Actinomycetota bacterium]